MGIKPKSIAEKRYTQRMLLTMVAYLAIVMSTTYLVRHEHVTGWLLYVCALAPVAPILWLLQVVALYLKEERDEFLRLQVIQSILWGAAAMLAISAFSDFLRSYTPIGTLPAFTLFVAFWLVFGLAQGVQSALNRVGSDDEPA